MFTLHYTLLVRRLYPKRLTYSILWTIPTGAICASVLPRDTTTCWLQWGLNLWSPDPITNTLLPCATRLLSCLSPLPLKFEWFRLNTWKVNVFGMTTSSSSLVICLKYVAFSLYSSYYSSLLPTILFLRFYPTAEGKSKAFLTQKEKWCIWDWNAVMPR